jgi:hypothetical protein
METGDGGERERRRRWKRTKMRETKNIEGRDNYRELEQFLFTYTGKAKRKKGGRTDRERKR